MTEEQFDPSREDPELRIYLSRLPRHDAPPALMAKLRRRYLGPTWVESLREWFAWPAVWKPAGLAFAATLMGIVWFSWNKGREANSIELGPLMAAHNATQAQGLIPDSNITAMDLSTQLAFYYERN